MLTEVDNDVVPHHQIYGEPEAIPFLVIKSTSLT
jgi:hypothetical protein